MNKLILALCLSPLLLAADAAKAEQSEEGKSFACVSIDQDKDWYITGKWAAETIELNHDGLVSTYRLEKVLEKSPTKENYGYLDVEDAGNSITIGHYQNEMFRARLFTTDSQDVFDNVTFDCKFSRR